MTKAKVIRLDMINLKACVFFNVFTSDKVKVVWRWNDRAETKYHAEWHTKAKAREIYRAYLPKSTSNGK